MKDLDHIHKLLEAYYLGKTSTREEEEIREFFSSGNFPEELAADAEIFGFFNQERTVSGNTELEEKILRAIDDSKSKHVNAFTKWRYYWVSSAAAVIIVLFAIFIDKQLQKDDPYTVEKDTYEDPYLAYVEAKRVMNYVSEKMNAGTGSLRNLKKLDAGVEYVQPVFSFGPGIQRLEYLNTVEKARILISK